MLRLQCVQMLSLVPAMMSSSTHLSATDNDCWLRGGAGALASLYVLYAVPQTCGLSPYEIPPNEQAVYAPRVRFKYQAMRRGFCFVHLRDVSLHVGYLLEVCRLNWKDPGDSSSLTLSTTTTWTVSCGNTWNTLVAFQMSLNVAKCHSGRRHSPSISRWSMSGFLIATLSWIHRPHEEEFNGLSKSVNKCKGSEIN